MMFRCQNTSVRPRCRWRHPTSCCPCSPSPDCMKKIKDFHQFRCPDFGGFTLSYRLLGAGWQNQVSEQNSPVQMTADDTLKTISEFLRWRWKNLGWQIVPAELSEWERRILWHTYKHKSQHRNQIKPGLHPLPKHDDITKHNRTRTRPITASWTWNRRRNSDCQTLSGDKSVSLLQNIWPRFLISEWKTPKDTSPEEKKRFCWISNK